MRGISMKIHLAIYLLMSFYSIRAEDIKFIKWKELTGEKYEFVIADAQVLKARWNPTQKLAENLSLLSEKAVEIVNKDEKGDIRYNLTDMNILSVDRERKVWVIWFQLSNGRGGKEKSIVFNPGVGWLHPRKQVPD